jgi:hypothetical protein
MRIFGKICFMTTKLNLTIEESTALKAKAYAAKNNTSISKLVNDYLSKITATSGKRKQKSFAEKYSGILTNTISIDKAKEEYLNKKYGY